MISSERPGLQGNPSSAEIKTGKVGRHFTLIRLATFVLVVMVLVGVGIALFWEYAYTPQGRARNILAEFSFLV